MIAPTNKGLRTANRPPVFVNAPYEQENGLHAILRYTDSIFVGVDALGDPFPHTHFCHPERKHFRG